MRYLLPPAITGGLPPSAWNPHTPGLSGLEFSFGRSRTVAITGLLTLLANWG